MKTYYKKDGKKGGAGRFIRANLWYLVLSAIVVAAALIITLSLLLNSPPVAPPPTDDNQNVDPPVTAPQTSYAVPVTNFTLGAEASLNELVYCSSLRQWRTHEGLDFIAAKGENVKAIADGTVTSVETDNLMGAVVTVTHANGLTSVYASLDADGVAAVGSSVKAGDVIGKIGEPAAFEYDAGSHLHLEITINGENVDPMDYFELDK